MFRRSGRHAPADSPRAREGSPVNFRTPDAVFEAPVKPKKVPPFALEPSAQPNTTKSIVKKLAATFDAAVAAAVPITPAVPKKRKPRKKGDGVFSPRGERRKTDALGNNSVGLIKARCNAEETVPMSDVDDEPDDAEETVSMSDIDDESDDAEKTLSPSTANDKRVPLKTAALIHGSPLGLDPDKDSDKENNSKLAHALNQKTADIKSHRPIKKITKFSEHQSPLQITTPNGTELKRTDHTGTLTVFSNAKARPKRTAPQINPAFFASDEFKNVVPVSERIKRKHYDLTRTMLNRVIKEKDKNNGHRSIKQSDVMKMEDVPSSEAVSASAYAHAAGFVPADVKCEFTHVAAHEHLGSSAQTSDNLGVATRAANTFCMIHEKQLKTILKEYPEQGVTITAEALCVASEPLTHAIEKIEYVVAAPGFTYRFVIEGDQRHDPLYATVKYWDALVNSLLQVFSNKEKEEQGATIGDSDKHEVVFFKRKARKLDVNKRVDFDTEKNAKEKVQMSV